VTDHVCDAPGCTNPTNGTYCSLHYWWASEEED
jgi:hypothetical protein